MTNLDNEPKKLWFKALALTTLLFITKDEITTTRFNIVIL